MIMSPWIGQPLQIPSVSASKAKLAKATQLHDFINKRSRVDSQFLLVGRKRDNKTEAYELTVMCKESKFGQHAKNHL